MLRQAHRGGSEATEEEGRLSLAWLLLISRSIFRRHRTLGLAYSPITSGSLSVCGHSAEVISGPCLVGDYGIWLADSHITCGTAEG